jgi:hypothetical protein
MDQNLLSSGTAAGRLGFTKKPMTHLALPMANQRSRAWMIARMIQTGGSPLPTENATLGQESPLSELQKETGLQGAFDGVEQRLEERVTFEETVNIAARWSPGLGEGPWRVSRWGEYHGIEKALGLTLAIGAAAQRAFS